MSVEKPPEVTRFIDPASIRKIQTYTLNDGQITKVTVVYHDSTESTFQVDSREIGLKYVEYYSTLILNEYTN